MARADVLLDNPVLVKHLRSRLRRDQVLPWAAAVVVLSLCILWAGQAFGIHANGTALAIMIGLEALILVLFGAQQVGGAVGGARESGILDFHRVSPQPPSWLALGFFLGAPAREYVLFAVTMPFAVILAWLSPAGPGGLIQLWVALVVVTWVFHAIALLSGLVSRKPKGAGKGGMAGLFVLAFILFRPVGSGIWYASTRLQDAVTIPVFGVPLPWLLVVVCYGAVLLGFLLLASARKMRAETAHVYTKSEAVACMAVLTVLLLGIFWGYPDAEFLVLAMLYTQTVLACVLVATVTPSHPEYVRGLRRALHRGRRRPSPWSDEGTNQLVTVLLAGLVFLGSTVARESFAGAGGPAVASQTIAIGVFVAAYFGFGMQYFLLRLPKSGPLYMTLFVLLAWMLPLLIGSIAFGAVNDLGLTQAIVALSPIAGITLSSGLFGDAWMVAEGARFAAIAPAITFAFLFAFLLLNVQRRLDWAVKAAAGLLTKPPGPFDYLDQPSNLAPELVAGDGPPHRVEPPG